MYKHRQAQPPFQALGPAALQRLPRHPPTNLLSLKLVKVQKAQAPTPVQGQGQVRDQAPARAH